MKKFLLHSSAVLALAIPATAHAQSTGSVDFDSEIIVTAASGTGIAGIDIPDTPKAKQVLGEEAIRAQRPGQTVNDIINLVPGVSFQNNDPWGSSGGSFTVRGFGADRVSQTVDGIPLNDSGNYALYTNQQIDSEVLEQVSVNLGTTDVDSPTASASGGTINIRTRRPADHFHITSTMSYGDVLAEGSGSRPYYRAFGMIDTGDITGSGTTAYFAASYTNYENPFNNYGKVDKQQYNAKIRQDIGDNGDFISVAGHYNENRNNFFGSQSLSSLQALMAAGDNTQRFYDINYPCTVASVPGVFETPAQVAAPGYVDPDGVNGCGAEFDRRYNPSNTGNVRGSSRFTLADGLVMSVDASYQYVKANGGGNEELLEGTRTYNGQEYTGFLRGGYYFGRDLNGDGDMLDEVSGFDPSQTRTRRYGVIASLNYDINEENRVRLAYTWDRADHRQTGQTSIALPNGEIPDVFPINDPVLTVDGFALNKRDRQSYAILHQVSGEYRGRFFDDALTLVLGLRAPFFSRELNQNCYTTSASGFIDCFENQDAAAYEAANPNAAPPQSREYKYEKLLPNLGLTFNVSDSASLFASYAKGLSVPGTDPLYDSLYLPDVAEARPVPETTDSFDLGLRFNSGNIQAQVAGWYTKYNNRLASAYDPILDETIYRNLGRVDKYGLDASIAWRPVPEALLYVFGSLNESDIKDNVANGACTPLFVTESMQGCTVVGEDAFLQTAGKRESGAPTFTLGMRGQYELGPVRFGAQVKRTGKRYANDENLPVRARNTGAIISDGVVPAYTLVDLDIRYDIAEWPTGGSVAVQLNVSNLFDQFYLGGFGGSLTAYNSEPFVQIGAPRAASLSLIIGY